MRNARMIGFSGARECDPGTRDLVGHVLRLGPGTDERAHLVEIVERERNLHRVRRLEYPAVDGRLPGHEPYISGRTAFGRFALSHELRALHYARADDLYPQIGRR